MTENERLYPYLVQAAKEGTIGHLFHPEDDRSHIIQRGIRLGFLQKFPNDHFRYELTEKGQKVVDANGDFSVVDERPTSVNVSATNAHVGDNSGTIHQSSVSNSNNQIPTNAPTTQPMITKILIGAISAILGGLAVWYLTEHVF